jgi:LPXTG-motif cell wall-anchored protein
MDPNNPFLFLDRMAKETGGQAWYFDKTALQPQPASPVMLDLLADQAIKAIKSAYRLDYTPPQSGREQRELVVTVKGPGGAELKTPATGYRGDPATGASTGTLLLAIGLPLLLIAGAGGFYYVRLRPVKTDYYLVGHGPSAGHVPVFYLYTDWRPVGRGGRGYQLAPEDPHFAGLSKTHVYVRVRNLRRVKGPTGAQMVGSVEVKAGKPSSGVGLNTTFVANELTGERQLTEQPFQLQTGDLLILQPATRQGQRLGGLQPGVYLRLGSVGGTVADAAQSLAEVDADKTIVDVVGDPDRTMTGPVEAPGATTVPGSRLQTGLQPERPPRAPARDR